MADSVNDEDGVGEPKQKAMLARHRQTDAERSKNGWFALDAREGWKQWWTNLSPQQTEHKVLSFVPFLEEAAPTHTQTGRQAGGKPEADDVSRTMSHTSETTETDPYGPRRWHSSLIKLTGKDRALNEFSVERSAETNVPTNNLVMLHGYGAGLGFFYKNFEPLSRRTGWRLYALDLLGMGRSARPPFRIHAKDQRGKIIESENWFIDALEEWRIQKGFERFTLLGHSLGGYLAVAYALKYPGHLNKLVLASPVGFPEDPYAQNAERPSQEPKSSTLPNEITQDQSQTTSTSNGSNKDAQLDPPPRRRLSKLMVYLWDANISPFSFIRWTGPLGPRLVSGWTSRRFGQMGKEESAALHDYAYSLFRQKGSGEYALAHILAPGAYARWPLLSRISGVGRGEYEPTASERERRAIAADVQKVRERGVPVVMVYGENDWMDAESGFRAKEILKEEKEKAVAGMSAEDASRDQGDAKVRIVRGAGHHVYLDGWQDFNLLMDREMEDVERRQKYAI